MPDIHWADTTAEKVIRERKKGDNEEYICSSGVTPSGIIHIGNFREIITTDFIAKALRKKGKKAKFILYWDDYDRFRKLPKGIPKSTEKHLGMPIGEVPDPFSCKHGSYAEHFEKEMEKDLPRLGIKPLIVRQIKRYNGCKYADETKLILNNVATIKNILNKYRKEPLEKDWLPIIIYCEKCKKDLTKVLEYDKDYKIKYECECGHKDTIDFRKKGIVKIKWRVQWIVWWDYEDVDFEPGGKEHYAAGGGSRITANEMFDEIYERPHPVDLKYDFIIIKGIGGKMSSSAGNVIRPKDLLEVYEPEIVRYLFASTRPNSEFSISFDIDVFKLYEDFDSCERVYFDKEKLTNKKEVLKLKRVYELSCIKEIPKEMPEQVGFRHLTTLLQVHEGNIEKATNGMSERTKNRARCAWNWLEKYAPEDMKFSVNKEVSSEIKAKLTGKQKKSLQVLYKRLEKGYDPDGMFNEFYHICKEVGIKNTEFFKGVYLVLISKEKGPRLSNFILTLGKTRVRGLLEQV